MILRLYYDLISPPSRALYILLKKAKTNFEPKLIDTRRGENWQPSYYKINRFRKVPVLEHDGFIVTESVAILRYLSRECLIHDSYFPRESKAHARVDEFLSWQHIGLKEPCSTFYRVAYLEPLIGCVRPNQHVVKPYFERMEEALQVFEVMWLGRGNTYILGETPTVADLLAVCEIEQTRMAKYVIPDKFFNIQNWYDKVKKNFNPYYREGHFVVDEIVKLYI